MTAAVMIMKEREGQTEIFILVMVNKVDAKK